MAVRLPNGVLLALATAYGAAVTVTAISNAFPAVVTAPGHGLTAGDIVVLTSGWATLNERAVRVIAPTADTFSLENIDTTDTDRFPAGGGVGSVMEVTGFTQITQVLDLTTNGGDMQFTPYAFLENDFESQLPTQASPMNLQITIGDDDTLAGYQALRAAAEMRAQRVLRMTLPRGAQILYNGVVSFNETPTMTRNQVMAVRATLSLQARPTRYAAPAL